MFGTLLNVPGPRSVKEKRLQAVWVAILALQHHGSSSQMPSKMACHSNISDTGSERTTFLATGDSGEWV